MNALCEQGCCEIMPPFNADDPPYHICADCGNDEGHEHGTACTFCGSTGLPPAAVAARLASDAEAEQMREHAERHIEADQGDPRTQRYFMRTDRRTVVKTEAEFKACQNGGIPMSIISHSQAVAILKQEKGKRDAAKKQHSKAKAARQARKKNRSR